MKITFVLPYVNLTGGIKILFEHANRLAGRGHQVTIIYPGRLFHGRQFETQTSAWRWHWLEAPLRRLKYGLWVDWLHQTEADWFPLDQRIRLHKTPDLAGRYLPDAAIVIATAPETVNWVAGYPASKGIKVHLAQDYEAWYLPDQFLASTFRHPEIHLITIGRWQAKLYQERFGRTVEAIIPDGVDTKLFRPGRRTRARTKSRPVRVLMNYHDQAYKGIADGLAAIKIAQAAGPIQTVMFGVHRLANDLPDKIEYHQGLATADLPQLYRACDIFLWPSHREGFGLPPMEAMACGRPVVGTVTGAMPDYMVNGQTGYLVPIKRPDRLGQALAKLVADPRRRLAMGRAGAARIKAWDWERQTAKLDRYLIGLRP